MILPIRAKNPPEQFPWMTCVLIALNVLIFGIVNIPGHIPIGRISGGVAAAYGLSYSNMSPVTFMTSMFLHGDILHLLVNMWFLYLYGWAVEGRMGWWKFAILYVLAGIAGDGLHLMLAGAAHPELPSIGASGAIMGVMGAAIYIFPHAKIQIVYWFGILFRGIFDAPMWGVGIFYILGDLVGAVLSASSPLLGGVANLAHLGGAAGGFLLAFAFRQKRDSEAASEAKATLADTKDYSMLNSREMLDMAVNQPNNTELTLHYFLRTMRQGYKLDDSMITRLKAHAPKMLEVEDPGALGWIFLNLPASVELRPVWLLDVGMKAEKNGSPQVAQQLYQKVFHMPNATEDDQESAAFKNAMLMEAWFQNYAGAEDLYRWILERWPLTPMEGQIKARLAVVTPRAAQQRATAHPTQ